MSRWWIVFCGFLWMQVASARGIQFEEEMRGHVYVGGEYRRASLRLKVLIRDIDAWRSDPRAQAAMSGMLFVEREPAEPMSGEMNILVRSSDGRLLIYSLRGTSMQFTGAKHVRDRAGPSLLDQMTVLRGIVQPLGHSAPPVTAMLAEAAWTSQLFFEWWRPAVVWNFGASMKTVDTPWHEELEVRAIFLKTVLGALAPALFPGQAAAGR